MAASSSATTRGPPADHYEVLGVPRGASGDEIRYRYRLLATTERPPELSPGSLRQQRLSGTRHSTHPGKAEANLEVKRRWRRIQEAYDVLMNPKRREDYDKQLPRVAAGVDARPDSVKSHDLPPPPTLPCAAESFFPSVTSYFNEVRSLEPGNRSGNLPDFGDEASAWDDVSNFYSAWEDWTSSRTYVDAMRHSPEAMAAAPRQSRRIMEQENEKLLKQRRREVSAQVRGFVEQARKQDPRVQAHRQVVAEDKARREEEREEKLKQEQEARADQRRLAREAEMEYWASSPDPSPEASPYASPQSRPGAAPFVCLACEKDFQTRPAWEAHAESRRHKQRARRWEAAGGGSVLLAEPFSPTGMSPGSSPPSRVGSKDSRPVADAELPDCFLPESMAVYMEGDMETEDEDQADTTDGVGPSLAPVQAITRAPDSEASVQSGGLELVVCEVPGHLWRCIFAALGDLRSIARVAAAFLASACHRTGNFGASEVWDALLEEMWGARAAAALKTDATYSCTSPSMRWLQHAAASSDVFRCSAAVAAPNTHTSGCAAWRSLSAELGGAAAVHRRTSWDCRAVSVAVSGSLVAVAASESSEVRLLGRDFRRLPSFRAKGKAVECVRLSADGNLLSVANADGMVSLYRVDDLNGLPERLRAPDAEATSQLIGTFAGVGFSEDGLSLLVAPRNRCGVVCTYDLETQKELDRFSLCRICTGANHDGLVSCEWLSPNTVAMLSETGGVKVWDFRASAVGLSISLEFPGDEWAFVGGLAWRGVGSGAALAVASGPVGCVHWADLTAGRAERGQLGYAGDAWPLQLVGGHRGSLLGWWGTATGAVVESSFLARAALAPLHTREAAAMVTAVGRPVGSYDVGDMVVATMLCSGGSRATEGHGLCALGGPRHAVFLQDDGAGEEGSAAARRKWRGERKVVTSFRKKESGRNTVTEGRQTRRR